MNKQLMCVLCAFGFFALLVGCGGNTTSARAVRASGLDWVKTQNKGPFHDDTIEQIDVRSEETKCQEKWGQTVPEEAPAGTQQARLRQQRIDWIIAYCEGRGDAKLALALGVSAPPPAYPYGGMVVGNGMYFPGSPAAAPVIFPNMQPASGASTSNAVASLQKDVEGLVGSQFNHEKRIKRIEEKSPPASAESEAPQ